MSYNNYYQKAQEKSRNYPRLMNIIPVPEFLNVTAIYRLDSGGTCAEQCYFIGIYENGAAKYLVPSPDGELDTVRDVTNFWRFDIRDTRKR